MNEKARRELKRTAQVNNISPAMKSGSKPPPPPPEPGAAVTLTVTDCVALPPGPVQVSEYVVVWLTWTAMLPPLAGCVPAKPAPVAVHAVASVVLQLSVVV